MSWLDKYIVGQDDAKRAVAIALRNRWRRHRVPVEAQKEVMPKNILLIGPTGSGKTEVARRIAKLSDSPFVKVEATKYTELGYVGRDVEDIVRELVEAAISLTRQKMQEAVVQQVARLVEDRILAALCGDSAGPSVLHTFREPYRKGLLDDRVVEVELPSDGSAGITMGETGGIIVLERVDRLSRAMGNKQVGNKKKLTVGEAKKVVAEAEGERLLAGDAVVRQAVQLAEQDGIVFIDEIDKIVDSGSRFVGAKVSSEGVQRDLLPIIEGCSVPTKHGPVSTDHMLFICSGAFHSSKPSDMLAELQGRLPIRVELQALTAADFYRILTEPQHNLVRQQQLLLETEGVRITFTDEALHTVASVAEEANRQLDNIGARRLHTVLEKVLADISFTAPELAAAARAEGQEWAQVVVEKQQVEDCMRPLIRNRDLSRYVL